MLEKRVRSGNMLGKGNPGLSLWVVKITQSLKPLKAEARAGFMEGCMAKSLAPTLFYLGQYCALTLRLMEHLD